MPIVETYTPTHVAMMSISYKYDQTTAADIMMIARYLLHSANYQVRQVNGKQ